MFTGWGRAADAKQIAVEDLPIVCGLNLTESIALTPTILNRLATAAAVAPAMILGAAVNLPAPVRYLRPEEGGVSHFHYWRDNALLTWMHVRLMLGLLARAPLLALRALRASRR